MKCSVLLSTHGQSAVRSDVALGSACRGSVIKTWEEFLKRNPQLYLAMIFFSVEDIHFQ